tara:strand:- start:13794 stop:13943 length:150 start_codon:yes stop_codon:yes gene_type:complete
MSVSKNGNFYKSTVSIKYNGKDFRVSKGVADSLNKKKPKSKSKSKSIKK